MFLVAWRGEEAPIDTRRGVSDWQSRRCISSKSVCKRNWSTYPSFFAAWLCSLHCLRSRRSSASINLSDLSMRSSLATLPCTRVCPVPKKDTDITVILVDSWGPWLGRILVLRVLRCVRCVTYAAFVLIKKKCGRFKLKKNPELQVKLQKEKTKNQW